MNDKQAIAQLDLGVKAELITGSSFWETAACEQIGLPSTRLSDGPHGLRVQGNDVDQLGIGASRPATCFPTASATACTFNEELCYGLGKRIGEEAAYFGVSMVLGPGLNVKRSPLCGRNFEYFSEDGYLSGKIAAAYVKGIQSCKVTACVKHFAVNCREYARMFCDSRVDEQTLRETYLTGFEIAVKEGGAGAVMTAYNKLNGVYCNQNAYLIDGILRGEWGFDGLVVSDWGGSHDRAEALKAGADLEMPVCKFSAPAVAEAVEKGELDESVLDRSVERLLSYARRSSEIERKPCDFAEHDAYAAKVAEECAVLLKNVDGALPLAAGERVALIGDFAQNPRYQGAGSSQVNPTSLVNILGEMQNSRLDLVGFEYGYERYGEQDEKLARRALKLAESADTVVFCLGLDEKREAEGSDRQDLKINRNQTDLLARVAALGKKVVAVLFCGSAVETDWDKDADALLLAHLSGQSGAKAVVKILTGEVNPSGRLAETYPVSLADAPCASVYNIHPLKTDFAEGVYVGYKYYNALGVPVKYPFGYGLSYTRFSLETTAVDRDGVTCVLSNVGEREGATVVQVYVRSRARELKDSPSELKAFRKVFLRAGEKKELFLPFDGYAFRRWNTVRHAFAAGGTYDIFVGLDSLSARLCGEVEITADRLPEGCVFAEESGEKLDYPSYFRSHISEDIPLPTGKRRVIATFDTPVQDLLYCKGVTGKIFGLIARSYARSDDKVKASSMEWLCLRSLLQFMNYNAAQAEGFLAACNGHFFRGMKKILTKK